MKLPHPDFLILSIIGNVNMIKKIRCILYLLPALDDKSDETYDIWTLSLEILVRRWGVRLD